MQIKLLAGLSAFASMAFAVPLSKRAEFCGQWDTQTVGNYIVYNNLWGAGSATSGSQCTEVTSSSSNTIAWKTSWSWAGGQYNVKSYANVALEFDAKPVSSVGSIPFSWSWSYTGTDMVANVAFDIWTSAATTGDYEYEIMVWLGRYGGAGPLGSQISTFSAAGTSWALYKGSNGAQTVYSYVAANNVNELSSDVLPFLTNLVSAGYIPSTHYLRAIQAGTEPFLGTNAVLTTSAYSVSVN